MIAMNSLKSNVMAIMPAPEFSPVDEISNQGFTLRNSFENDVLGVTPMDDSAPD
jgi:hypothetical protein